MARSDFYKAVLDNLYDGVYFVDRARRITYWNRGAERISGHAPGAVVGTACSDNLLVHVDGEGRALCLDGCPLARTIEDGIEREADVYLRHARGHRVAVRIRVSPVRDDEGRITGAVESFSDNSAIVAARRQAGAGDAEVRDLLTGVASRRFLELRLRTSLLEGEAHGLPTGVVFINIDGFAALNETNGGPAGDRVLRMVADTLRHAVRESDFVGRWDGDAFVVILFNVNAERLASLANKLRVLVGNSSLVVGTSDLRVSVSAGATLMRAGESLEALMDRAGRLLAESKAGGRDRVCTAV